MRKLPHTHSQGGLFLSTSCHPYQDIHLITTDMIMSIATGYSFQRTLRIFLLLYLVTLSDASNDVQDSVIAIAGNVTFAAIFSVNDLEKETCGEFDYDSMQSIMAITWFLQALNSMNYVPGVTIGLEVHRTCKQPHRATEAVSRLFNKYGLTDNDVLQENLLYGLLGPGRTSEAIAVSSLVSLLPSYQRVAQISGSATGKQLSNSSIYPTFFRVIPPDDTQVQVILELLKQLKWNYFAIVYDDDEYGRSAATELKVLAELEHLCVPVFASVPLDPRSEAFQIKGYSIAEQLRSPANGLVRGVIILGGPSTTKQLQQTFNSRVTYVRLILSEAVNLQRATLLTPSGNNVSTITAGALITSPSYIHLPEFVPLWNELWTNESVFEERTTTLPWMREYFAQLSGCPFNSPDCWSQAKSLREGLAIRDGRTLDLFTGYQVKAAAVMAASLKQLQDQKCGAFSPGLCQELKDAVLQRIPVLDSLRHSELHVPDLSSVFNVSATVTVRFDAATGNVISDDSDPEYLVYNFRRDGGGDFNFVQIGEWMNHQLSVNTSRAQFYTESGSPRTWSQFPPAQCNVNHDCLKCERDVSNDVIIVEGDFYVVAIVPVSDRDPQDLLTCGDVKAKTGADLAQSLVYAVQRVNNRTGIFQGVLPGKSMGLLVINSCGSQLLVRQRLMQLHAGTLPLPGQRTSVSILPYILGYVGEYYSANSMAASETLNAIGRPFVQISGASTSTDLSDTEKYPNFLRLPAPDDMQAQAMLDIVRRIGASYIQVIYDSSTAYATALYHKLQELVTSSFKDVCIAQSIAVQQEADATKYTRIVSRLRLKERARVVLVILHLEVLEPLLDNVLPYLDVGEFRLLASESWGRRQKVLQGEQRRKLEGSLVLSQELRPDLHFQEYFLGLDPQASGNPWLRSFWENRLGCYFSMSFRRKGKSGLCGELADMEDNAQDTRVPFHIFSLYALVLGVSKALTDRCGSHASRVCDLLTSEDFFSAMLEVELDLFGTGKRSRLFDDHGNGLVGYKVLQISRDVATPADVTYRGVGSWSNYSLDLRLEDLYFPGGSTFETTCSPSMRECAFCSETQSQGGLNTDTGSKENVPVAAFVSVIVILIVIIAVVVVVFFLCFKRRRKHKAGANDTTKPQLDEMAFAETASRSHPSDPGPTARQFSLEPIATRSQQRLPPRPPPDGNHVDPQPQPPPASCQTALPPNYLHPVPGDSVDPEQTDLKRMVNDGYAMVSDVGIEV